MAAIVRRPQTPSMASGGSLWGWKVSLVPFTVRDPSTRRKNCTSSTSSRRLRQAAPTASSTT
jgi:hypothetical protein